MKKYFILTFLLFIFIVGLPQSDSVKRLGIINPTPRNLENIIFLLDNEYIIIDSFNIIGIYHESQTELIEATRQFIEDCKHDFISIDLINNNLSIDSLFCKNSCTSEFKRVFNKTDALLFLGGADISPHLYGEKTFLTTVLIPSQRNWELSFIYHLTGGFQDDSFKPLLEQRPDYLILGICLGMQEMNVASGGSLFQDIPFQIYRKENYEDIMELQVERQHKNYWKKIDNWNEDVFPGVFHHIRIIDKSFLEFDSLRITPMVTSVHHQSVRKLGKNYKVSATSMDRKVIEAFEHIEFKNVNGIQFHTEFPILYKDNHELKISPTNSIEPDSDTKLFHILFWKDFSNRLIEQN